ncbi:MAG: hypothetical protein CM1200mP29_13070 [Verrucomicrobiota bacterium]|nr:MAG: hypothetical protein CM1200mP29_13070 [Verrucomicrobiota bacterium]
MRRLMAAQLSMVRHVEPLLTLEGLRWAGLAHRPGWWVIELDRLGIRTWD